MQCGIAAVMSGAAPAATSTVKPPDEKPNAPTRSGSMAARIGEAFSM